MIGASRRCLPLRVMRSGGARRRTSGPMTTLSRVDYAPDAEVHGGSLRARRDAWARALPHITDNHQVCPRTFEGVGAHIVVDCRPGWRRRQKEGATMFTRTNHETCSILPSATTMSLAELIEKHSSAVGQSLRRLGVAPADVDDARQQVWLTAAHCMGRIRRGAERAFLMTLVRHEAGHVRRSYRRRPGPTAAEVDELPGVAVSCDEMEDRRRRVLEAHAVLAEMSDELRSVLWLGEIVEASTRDIAGLLGIPLGTAKSRLRRARTEGLRRGTARASRGASPGAAPSPASHFAT